MSKFNLTSHLDLPSGVSVSTNRSNLRNATQMWVSYLVDTYQEISDEQFFAAYDSEAVVNDHVSHALDEIAETTFKNLGMGRDYMLKAKFREALYEIEAMLLNLHLFHGDTTLLRTKLQELRESVDE